MTNFDSISRREFLKQAGVATALAGGLSGLTAAETAVKPAGEIKRKKQGRLVRRSLGEGGSFLARRSFTRSRDEGGCGLENFLFWM